MSDRVPIRCDECNTPVAELRGEVLVIRSRHFGQTHVTTIPVQWLMQQCGILHMPDEQASDERLSSGATSRAATDRHH